jgi:DNA-binding transcriptional regulator YiaG
MRKTWKQLKNETMTAEEQQQARTLAMRDLAEMELAELREALHLSQQELAGKLKVTQAAISRLERRPNVLIESIANYIEALGGRLELHAVLPNRTVKLTHLLSRMERKKTNAAMKKKHRAA